MKRIALLLLLSLCLFSAPVMAQGGKAEARTYFKAGLQAYKAGQFLPAARAFIEARKLFPNSKLTFSIAQAFRRQFQTDQDKAHAQLAVKHYREYLGEVKEGGRRLEAAQALGELAPFAGEGGGGAMALETRLMVSSSAPGAVVTLDGGPVHAAPLSEQVKPGNHKVLVRAPGYASEERTVVAVKGGLIALDVPLKGKPALLEVVGADGSEIVVDGRTEGDTPLTQPLELEPGTHFVAVTKRGHRAYSEELTFEHGATTKVTLDLPETDQRAGAYVVLGVAAASAVATGVLFGLAAWQDGVGNDVRDAQAAGPITEAQRVEHNDAINQRDDFVVAGSIAAGATGAIGITALLIYLLDTPEVAPPSRGADKTDDEPDANDESNMDVMAGVGPAGGGVSVRITF
jgi:hypothetical protein